MSQAGSFEEAQKQQEALLGEANVAATEKAKQDYDKKFAMRLLAHLKAKHGVKVPEGVDVLAEMNDSPNALPLKQGTFTATTDLGEASNGTFDWKQCRSEANFLSIHFTL